VPSNPAARRGWLVSAACAVLGLLYASTSAFADVPPLYRLFLRDGATVTSLGEYVRVGERVVVNIPVTGSSNTRLVSLSADLVDWPRTEKYADSLRAAIYADSRGDADFSALAGEVARELNEIALAAEPSQKLQLAEEARRRLQAWPIEHFGYRAADVAQIVQLVDEAISELRASAGGNQFDLALVANVAATAAVPLLPEPSPDASLQGAFDAAERADDPAERITLLEAIQEALSSPSAPVSVLTASPLRMRVAARLREEREVEIAYARLASTAGAVASRRAAQADVRSVERLIARVRHDDARLGQKRPARVAALLAALQDRLDAARRLQLARDQWSLKIVAFRNYRRAMTDPLRDLQQMSVGLDDIKRLAGPPAMTLPGMSSRTATVVQRLSTIVPPPDLAAVHALVQSAAQMAAQAIGTRMSAVSSGVMSQAWQASSAAAGALMLMARAKHDLDAALAPPALQ
jgi:hypothetical protein